MKAPTHLIGLKGQAQSGKDSVGRFLEEFGFKGVAFADRLREKCLKKNPQFVVPGWFREEFPTLMALENLDKIVFVAGWDKAKKIPEIRQYLQEEGTERGRDIYGEDYWVDQCEEDWQGHNKVHVKDVRFPNEGRRVHDRGGKIWEIIRPGFDNGLGENQKHRSETEMSKIPADVTIVNDGTLEDLRYRVYAAFFKPIGHWVLCERLANEETVEGTSIVRPDSAWVKNLKCRVLCVGDGRRVVRKDGTEVSIPSTGARPGSIVIVRQFEDQRGQFMAVSPTLIFVDGRVIESRVAA